VAGQQARLWTYGSFSGPTLRVREGDRVELELRNSLPEATNLHLHGLHVPPSVDDAFLSLAPGERRIYEFDVPFGSAGTYWYHPHLHGRVATQLFAGLAGAIVVEGPSDELFAEAEEHLLVLKDLSLQGGRGAEHEDEDWMNGKEGELVLVNGQRQPALRPERRLLRLRLLNASNARYYRMALEEHPLYLLATDGGLIEKPLELSELLLAPGERAEVLVRLEGRGQFRLLNLPYDRGTMTAGQEEAGDRGESADPHAGHGAKKPSSRADDAPGTLLTIQAPSTAAAGAIPSTVTTVSALEPSGGVTRRIVLGEDHMAADFFINGRAFDHHRVDLNARLGDTEIWEIVNEGDMDHPFHLHVYPFQVLSRNGAAEAVRAWKDVVNLRAGERLSLAVPLADFSGRTVFHCHIVEHEDRGMMGVLEVS
jgi:FtsP/CotA-like multicopper oxidase with cupredoxin domain